MLRKNTSRRALLFWPLKRNWDADRVSSRIGQKREPGEQRSHTCPGFIQLGLAPPDFLPLRLLERLSTAERLAEKLSPAMDAVIG